MNRDDPLEQWLIEKRDVSSPASFADRVMSAAVQRPKPPASIASAAKSARQHRSLSSRCVPYLIASAAIVIAVRAYSLVLVLIQPTPEYSVVAVELIEEIPNDDRDASRS